MVQACTAANRTGSFLVIDDMTPDRSNRMNADVYKAIVSPHIH